MLRLYVLAGIGKGQAMPRQILLLMLILLFFVTGLPRAQPITVSVPDTVVTPGSSITLPVVVSDVTGRQIGSVLMNLTYSSKVLMAENVSINGTMASIFVDNVRVDLDTPGRIVVDAAAENEVLEGEGALFLVDFTVTGDIGDTTLIHFDEFVFNEGAPSVTTEEGLLRIRPSGTGVIVWVRTDQDTVYYGERFRAEIWAENVTDFGSYQLVLGFDPDLVHAVHAQSGSFLGSTGRAPMEVKNAIDNVGGTVTLTYVTIGTPPGPDGGGKLAIVEFEAQQKVSAAESFYLQIGSDDR